MLLTGQFQNAYVTRDMERAIALLREQYGVEGINVFDASIDVTTPAGSGPAKMKTALVWIGNIQYELIEPIEGLVDIYRDALPDNEVLKFHHICMRPHDLEQVRAEIKRRQIPIVYEGETAASKFFYVDTRATLGHYLEYVWMRPEMWAALGGR